MSLVEKLSKGVVLLDGSTGGLLASTVPDADFPQILNITNPDAVRKLTDEYIAAGSQIIQTNTFGGNRPVLEAHGLGDKMEEINEKGCEIALKSVEGTDVMVAGDIGPTGLYFAPAGYLDFERAVHIFTEQMQILKKAGIKLLCMETFMDINEMRAAIMAAKHVGGFEIISSMTFKDERTMNGTRADACAVSCACLGADVVGANCSGGPKSLMKPLELMGSRVPNQRSAKPNAGLPQMKDGKTTYEIGADDFAQLMVPFAEHGVRLLGGCCGTTPAYITALKKQIHAQTWPEVKANGPLGPWIASPLESLDMSRDDLTFTEMIFPEIDEDMVEDDFMSVSDILPVDWESCDACVLDFRHLKLDFDIEKLVTAVTLFLKKPVIIRHGSKDVVELFLRYYPGRCALCEGLELPDLTFGALMVGAGYKPVEAK